MHCRVRYISLVTLVLTLTLVLPSIDGGHWRWSQASAQSAAGAAEAFAAAKELGTLEAWEAFLTNYPTGFHADLARAYVKEMAKGSASPAAAPAATAPAAPNPVPSPTAGPAALPAPAAALSFPPANELPCRKAAQLSSYSSSTPAKLIFVNSSGAPRGIVWIDFKGRTKEYARLANGEQLTQETFLTHPWMAVDEDGDCTQLFMPGQDTSVAVLEYKSSPSKSSADDDDDRSRPRKTKTKKASREEDDHGPTPEQTCKNIGQIYKDGVCVKPSKTPKKPSAAQSCKELGMAYKNGQCVAKAKADIQRLKKQKKIGCPPGTYLNPLGVCQPNETGG